MGDPFSTSAGDTGGSEPKRDRWGRYLLPHPDTGKEQAWTRATTFAKSISDTYVLSQWGQRMVAKGLAMRPDLYALAAATPIDERDQLNDIAERAKEAAGAKSAASLGTALHAFTERLDRGEETNVPDPWVKDVEAYRQLVADAGLSFDPRYIERIVVVVDREVAGTFDRLALLTKDIVVDLPGCGPITLKAGTWVVLDLKTGRDLTYGWNEIAIQLRLYSEACGVFNQATGEWEPMPTVNTDVALVIHLPVGQAKATLHAVNIAEGAAAADLCQSVREWRKVRSLATPLSVSKATPAEVGHAAAEALPAAQLVRDRAEEAKPKPRKRAPKKAVVQHTDPAVAGKLDEPTENMKVVVPPTWEDRIDTATTKAELSTIRKEAMAAGAWSNDLLERGLKQMSKFATA